MAILSLMSHASGSAPSAITTIYHVIGETNSDKKKKKTPILLLLLFFNINFLNNLTR
jgi:hypothetical protein